jgi:hypothetical protein
MENSPRWSLLGRASLRPTEEQSSGPVYSNHFLLLGDSMLKTAIAPVLKVALERAFEGATVDLLARSATGLARPDVFDWEAKVKEELERKGSLKTVMIFLGTNDAQNIQIGKEIFEFGSEEWSEVYSQRVRSILELTCGKSSHVYWVGSPPMRNEKFHNRILVLNEIVKSSIRKSAGILGRTGERCAHFISTSGLISDEKGKFSTYIKKGTERYKVRESDGIHLTLEGAEILSRSLLKVIRKPLELVRNSNP